jgi:hypothetical protein
VRRALCILAIMSLAAGCGSDRPASVDRTTTTDAGLVVPPLSEFAAWETPASQVPTSSRTADWARRIWEYADAFDKNLSIEFGLDEPSNDYSIPVYRRADATTSARVFARPWNGTWDIEEGARIPWNPDWRPSDGNDAFLVVVDEDTGQEWDLWAVSSPDFDVPYMKQSECRLDPRFDPDTDLCAAAVMIVRRPDGRPADVRTYRGNYPPASGGGLQNTAGLTTPEEVASGAIRHAMKFAVSPALSMTGPACPPEVTTPDDPRVGTSCGLAVAPAGQHERVGTDSSGADLRRMVPHGTRFVLDLSDAEITAWLDGRGYRGRLRETARVFAVALRDYGLIQTDSTGGPAIIQVAGGRNPEIAAGWRALGITDDGSTLLDGLMTRDNIRVLAPAKNRCEGRVSRLACWASDTGY